MPNEQGIFGKGEAIHWTNTTGDGEQEDTDNID
jgi:hypothetical protein